MTCICCKVPEHTTNIMAHLDRNKLLFPNQHGFRSRVSCETQLIQFTQSLYATLNQSGQADVIVMDFNQAFDKADHQRFLLKLHKLGIKDGWSHGSNRSVQTELSALFLTVNSQSHAQSRQVFPKDLYWVHVFSSCISRTCLKVYKAA